MGREACFLRSLNVWERAPSVALIDLIFVLLASQAVHEKLNLQNKVLNIEFSTLSSKSTPKPRTSALNP